MKTLLAHAERWVAGGAPGTYVCRLVSAEGLAAELSREPWVQTVTVGEVYLTVTITPEALARVAVDVARAGSQCVASDALRGRTAPASREADLAAAPDWEQARAALAAELTASLAVPAGATLEKLELTAVPDPGTNLRSVQREAGPVAQAIAYAGNDAVRFAVARMRPGGPAPEPADIARHVLGNPAYAVRYAHAAAASVLRWAGAHPGLTRGQLGEFRPHQLTEPGELVLLDALSWLPERVATAARRGRPDEFARYLETLASRTIDTMSTTGFAAADLPSERLWLAEAARTGLAAGLGLLGIAAPDRL
jgi:hypothetical protein